MRTKLVIKDSTMQLVRDILPNHVGVYRWIKGGKSSQYFSTGSDAIKARQSNKLIFS